MQQNTLSYNHRYIITTKIMFITIFLIIYIYILILNYKIQKRKLMKSSHFYQKILNKGIYFYSLLIQVHQTLDNELPLKFLEVTMMHALFLINFAAG